MARRKLLRDVGAADATVLMAVRSRKAIAFADLVGLGLSAGVYDCRRLGHIHPKRVRKCAEVIDTVIAYFKVIMV
jgi:hypothetical protein